MVVPFVVLLLLLLLISSSDSSSESSAVVALLLFSLESDLGLDLGGLEVSLMSIHPSGSLSVSFFSSCYYLIVVRV